MEGASHLQFPRIGKKRSIQFMLVDYYKICVVICSDVLCDYLLGNLGQKTGSDIMLSCQDGCVPCHQVMNKLIINQ